MLWCCYFAFSRILATTKPVTINDEMVAVIKILMLISSVGTLNAIVDPISGVKNAMSPVPKILFTLMFTLWWSYIIE